MEKKVAESGSWVSDLFGEVPVFIKDMNNRPKCPVCGTWFPKCLSWTICNGIAVCICTAQFRIYNRDPKTREILPKEPICLVTKELIPAYQKAWEEQHIDAEHLVFGFESEKEKFEKYRDAVKKINEGIDEST
ncbi:MAG: hypothetical protein ABID61_04955 [Candidatus Micrarchaeota archaeon]